MGRIVRVDFGHTDDPTIEFIIAQVMAHARRRTGLAPGQFARALNAATPGYDPGLMPESIEAFESGRAIPSTDVFLRAVQLGGRAAIRSGRGSSGATRPAAGPR